MPYDDLHFAVAPLPILFLGLLFLCVIWLISLDFLHIRVFPVQHCPRCHRAWVPLSHDPDFTICNNCRNRISLSLTIDCPRHGPQVLTRMYSTAGSCPKCAGSDLKKVAP